MELYNELQKGGKWNEDGTFNWYSGQGQWSKNFLDRKLKEKQEAIADEINYDVERKVIGGATYENNKSR